MKLKSSLLSIIITMSLLTSCNNSTVDTTPSDVEKYFYESIKIDKMRFEEYANFTNVIIPIKNNGNNNISYLCVEYYFLDKNNDIISKELNVHENIKAKDSLELVSSYSLDNVKTVKIYKIAMSLSEDSYREFELKTPIICKYK